MPFSCLSSSLGALLRRDKTAIRHATQRCLLFLSSRCRFEFNSEFCHKSFSSVTCTVSGSGKIFYPPTRFYLRFSGEVEERFISLPGSLLFFLHYSGNKPLSWPKTDYVGTMWEINTVNTQINRKF